MRLIDVIEVDSSGNRRRIELYQGELTVLSPHDAVDVLIISAFPYDYTPTATSLIGALFRKGVVVMDLESSPAADLRKSFSCWMSSDIHATDPGIQFRRILCFEPQKRGTAPALIGDIFRALAPFLGDHPPITKVAMPLITSGDQGYPVSQILPTLIDAAVHWLKVGLPLECLKIVAFSDYSANEAEPLFAQLKRAYTAQDISAKKENEYDVFLSYSHCDSQAAARVREELVDQRLTVFFDSQSMDKGVAWQQQIFSALDSCDRLIALYSPAYVTSQVCQEEFNIAWARGRKMSKNIIFPMYWESAELPTYMEMLNFFDCREKQTAAIRRACQSLVAALRT